MWAKNLGNRRGQKAFTLMEVAVAGILTAIIAVGAMYWLYSNTDLRKVQETKKDLQLAHRDLMNLIRKDLNSAFKVSGSTADCSEHSNFNCFPGISRIDFEGHLAGYRRSDESFDGIRILSNAGIALKAYISQPTESPVGAVTVTDNLWRQHQPGSESEKFNKNLFRLMRKLITSNESDLIYLGNAQTSHIGQVKHFVLPDTDELKSYSVSLESSHHRRIDLADLSISQTTVAPAFIIEWVVDKDKGHLIRRKRTGIEAGSASIVPGSEEVMATGIKEFLIDYSFANNRTGVAEVDWPNHNAYYSHPRDPSYLLSGSQFPAWDKGSSRILGQCIAGNPDRPCCTAEARCVNWGDLESVRIRIQYQKKMNVSSAYLATVGDDFSIDNGTMNWQSAALVYPENYSMQGKLTETTGVQINCQLNPANRCGRNPSCTFNGEDPSQPDWKGFGNPNSAYCICGGCVGTNCDNFVPPETPEGRSRVGSVWDNNFSDLAFYEHPSGESHVLNGVDARSRRQLACLSHFDVVAEAEWRNIHHLAYLVRTCLPTPEIVRRPATTEEQNDNSYGNPLWIYSADPFRGTLNDGDPAGDGLSAFAQAMETGNYPSGITPDDYMDCETFSYCDSPVLTQMLGRFRGGTGSLWHRTNDPNDPATWTPKPYRNFCGCLLEQNPAERIRYDYNLRCNHDIRPENVAGTEVRDWGGQLIDRPVCTTTWNPGEVDLVDNTGLSSESHRRVQKIYRVRASGGSPAFPQGLRDEKEAILCQCYAEAFEQNYQIDWNNDGNLEDYRFRPQEGIPGSHGFSGQSYWVDFREPESVSGCGFDPSTQVYEANRIDPLHNLPGITRRSPSGQSPLTANWSRLLSTSTMKVRALVNDGSGVRTVEGICAPDRAAPTAVVAANQQGPSSSIAPCTDPEHTFESRAARGEITAQQRDDWYAALGDYGRGGLCGDRSSYCSPRCGQWTGERQLADLGITQARNFLINRTPPTGSASINRNLLPDFCGGPGAGSGSQ